MSVQTILIINLSASELTFSVLRVIRIVLFFIIKYDVREYIVKDIAKYMLLFMYIGVTFWYFLAMGLLTFDRLLHIILNLRYNRYITKRRVKIVLMVLWILSVVCPILVENVDDSAVFKEPFHRFYLFGYKLYAIYNYA